ncbi:MAG: GvpL/GvpF family gas vesicle protein [Trichodesmium sp. St18_bin1]|nr:GvpL/GvpF family gas vesicle protein [Trichodesmium sp. St18_bin1]MDE5118307.1 GvpL/GvpF family gas vesicle protein [Trichodesmium sp. St2_bin2_1]MDE5123393.1 GvpL/GvpF family gas vesicle protein [Trichodesmium sp. St19_bin1]
MKSGFYVYGIFNKSDLQNLSFQGLDQQGLDKEDVNFNFVDDEFAVLYSIAKQERYLASRRNLLTHEKVLELAMEAGYKNVLPMQFGLVVSDWEKLSQQLINPFREEMKELFAKLENNREVGVKVYWETDAELQKLLAENDELKSQRDSLIGQNLSMEQVIEIGQVIEQEMNSRKQDIIEIFQTNLNQMAIDVVENDLQTEKMIYNAAYLIPWESEPEFGKKVEAIDSKFEGRFTVRYNSFTAPFNFARIKQKD